MAITLPKLSDMMRGDCVKLSERELMNCFNIIGGSILDAAHGDDSSGKAVCA